jgi:hypothetical protein
MTLRWRVLGEKGGGSATAFLSPLLKTECHSERSEESAVDEKECLQRVTNNNCHAECSASLPACPEAEVLWKADAPASLFPCYC